MNGMFIEKLSDPGPRPKLVWRHKNELKIDESYQRTMETYRSKTIIEKVRLELDWKKFGVLIVTEDGFIIDGQHRHAGIMMRADIDVVPCLIHNVTVSEAASIFVGMNLDRVNITPLGIFKAQLAAGHPEAVMMKKAADEAGVELMVYPKVLAALKPKQTQAVSTIRGQVKYRPKECVRAMKCCIAAKVILSAGALQAAFRHIISFDDDELATRMLRQTFLRHVSLPPDQTYIPIGNLQNLPAIPAPIQTGEFVGGVKVRRFEAGNRDSMVVRALEENGHKIELDNAGYKGMDSRKATLDGKVVGYAMALMKANEYRVKQGLPRI